MRELHRIFKSTLQLKDIKLGFSNLFIRRGLKFASDVKWVRPEKKSVFHPDNTGDLGVYEPPAKETLRLGFDKSQELNSAPEAVKKIFTLEYLNAAHKYSIYEASLMDKVRRHCYDTSSLEVKIAKVTAAIRFNQSDIELKPSKKKGAKKKVLKELIDKRQKQLTNLRHLDYKRFEWLLEKLELVYKPKVLLDGRVPRKKAMTLIAQIRAEEQKEEALAALKKSLDEQKVPFFEKKLEKLKWIKAMEEKNNLPVTVTADDIKICSERLEELKTEISEKLKTNYKRKIHPFTLEKYYEDLLLEKENSSAS